MNDRLELAIVGCGDIAAYVSSFAWMNGRIGIRAFVDPNKEKAAKLARRYRVQDIFTEYQDLLDQTKLDAVYLAVPHDLHKTMIIQAVERGLHVLVEKPVTRTLDEALNVLSYTKSRKIKIGVNYQYRYDRGCFALARAVQRGDLGEVQYIQCSLPWKRTSDYFRESGWHATLERAGGGTLITQGSHLLDIALWAVGQAPVQVIGDTACRVFKDIEVETLAFGVIKLKNGARIQITSSMIANPEQPLEIKVYGEKGTAIYTNKPRPRVKFLGVSPRKERPPTRGLHALQRSLEGFRAWVKDGKPYLTPIQEALPVLAAVEGIYTSSKMHQAVDIDTAILEEIH